MSSLLVLEPGLLTTVQDLGRPGFGPIGVSPGGAADSVSLRLGNWLVGNPAGAAALEMTLAGGAFQFSEPTVVALTGSDFGARVDGVAVEPWTAADLRAGETLRMGATRSGARCYLCVRGGIDVPRVLDSTSTHLLSGLGGFEGRALRAGDRLTIGEASGTFRARTLPTNARHGLFERSSLRVTPGPQAAWFSAEAVRSFGETSYEVSEQSNRMGLRLDGLRLEHKSAPPMISEGVSLGAIQVTPDGAPILLFVDQQTTGGYLKIANVISTDLHRVGQLRPRDLIRFNWVTLERAIALLQEQERSFAEMMAE